VDVVADRGSRFTSLAYSTDDARSLVAETSETTSFDGSKYRRPATCFGAVMPIALTVILTRSDRGPEPGPRRLRNSGPPAFANLSSVTGRSAKNGRG